MFKKENTMHINMQNLKQAMIGQVDRNNIVANNLANINTTGFKKDFVFFDAFNKELERREGEHQQVDFNQGQLVNTSNPLDLALAGKGFFTVETDTGVAYTRDGHFKLSPDGFLQTQSGHSVMGETGPVIILGEHIKPEQITITEDGEIYSDDELVGRLQIVDFENKGQLKKIGENMFAAKDDAEEVEPESLSVRQGYLEGSNVNPADEMIQLIEVQRQFETMQKMVRSLDDVFRMAAEQVGRY